MLLLSSEFWRSKNSTGSHYPENLFDRTKFDNPIFNAHPLQGCCLKSPIGNFCGLCEAIGYSSLMLLCPPLKYLIKFDDPLDDFHLLIEPSSS
jgi:hypothetical protein